MKGVVPHLVPGGITPLQYADNIFLMVDGDSIKNIKFLLYCFEWMSGMKINYQSEMVLFGMGADEQ